VSLDRHNADAAARRPVDGEADVLHPAEPGSAWVVVHTRPRCEKKIVSFCAEHGMASYLPLLRKVHRYGSREKVFSSPVFSGYVFCIVRNDRRAFLRQNRHVANVLLVSDQEKLVNQLRAIRTALESGRQVEVMPYLERGGRVRVTAGPLRGLEGRVLRMKGATRVIVNVDMIRQAVAVEVDSSNLAPV